MRDYHQHDYNKGYKSAPEIVLLAVVVGYLVAELSWEHVFNYFGF